MANEKILVVEDEADIKELICYNLEKEGFSIRSCDCGEEALRLVEQQLPDLILLDLMLPGIGGLDVCRDVRRQARSRQVPIIMLTAKSEEPDIVAGLELGADDYVTKPFSPRVLLARVRAVLRRAETLDETTEQQATIRRGDLEIDSARHRVTLDGLLIDLTFTEFRVLELLARRAGIVFTRYQIVDAVKGEDYPVTDRSVDVQIVGLRKKLGRHSELIETVRGVGYRFRSA